MKSFDATQKKKVGLCLPKEKKKTLIDELVRKKKAVPGVGKYEDKTKCKVFIILTKLFSNKQENTCEEREIWIRIKMLIKGFL